jgi:hypothetical protein
MATPKKPKYLAHCVDCGDSAGWVEGRGRQPLRCGPCYSTHLTSYNRQAKRKERFATRLGKAVNV